MPRIAKNAAGWLRVDHAAARMGGDAYDSAFLLHSNT